MNDLKRIDIMLLIKQFGENTTLGELAATVKPALVYKCTNCNGFGKIIEKTIGGFEWAECKLCKGEGYTERDYMIELVADIKSLKKE